MTKFGITQTAAYTPGSVMVSAVRNVNEAFKNLMDLSQVPENWRAVSPRGMDTLEWRGTFITEYAKPQERVLFNPVRDANPFFHFMEALWIMDGRDDVAFLNQFNSNISTFSDDGKTFNAPYGYRLRRHFGRTQSYDSGSGGYEEHTACDQLAEVIALLRREPDTRRAVLCLWDPVADLNRESKDIPCNDLVTFKLRDDMLDMTVMNRSNDAMWGAYGANAVQFSFLQEFIAQAVGARIGRYRQISDSFHVYTKQAAWQKCLNAAFEEEIAETGDKPTDHMFTDHYVVDRLRMVPLMQHGVIDWKEWLAQNNLFLNDMLEGYRGATMPFFTDVAMPLMWAWRLYKNDDEVVDKNTKIDAAQGYLSSYCAAEDWTLACIRWLERRRK